MAFGRGGFNPGIAQLLQRMRERGVGGWGKFQPRPRQDFMPTVQPPFGGDRAEIGLPGINEPLIGVPEQRMMPGNPWDQPYQTQPLLPGQPIGNDPYQTQPLLPGVGDTINNQPSPAIGPEQMFNQPTAPIGDEIGAANVGADPERNKRWGAFGWGR